MSSLRELRKRKVFETLKEWNKFADNESDEIKRYIFRWISFNGLYSALYAMEHGQNKTENTKDNTKITYFLKNFILADKIPVSEIYSDDVFIVFTEKIKTHTHGMGVLLRDLEQKNNLKETVSIMIRISYKIRSRIFHGEKNPDLDVNKIVANAADQFIKRILNYIIEEQ